MADIKSALDIAKEKLEKMEGATEEERLRWKSLPVGEALAAKYLKGEANLLAELGKYSGRQREYIVEGISRVLANAISLPRNEEKRRANRQAMDGLKLISKDKAAVENIYSNMRRIFDHHVGQGAEQRQQAHEQLKAEFERRIKEAQQREIGAFKGMKIDVERQPQFQEEWRRAQLRLDGPYETYLREFRHELLTIH